MPMGQMASAWLPRGRASLMEKIPRQFIRRDVHMQVRDIAPCE